MTSKFVHRCGYVVDIAEVADLVQERDVMIEGIDLILVVLGPDLVQEGNVRIACHYCTECILQLSCFLCFFIFL